MKSTKAIRRKLGALLGLAGQTVAEVIRSRGGTAANVKAAGPWAQRTLGETAEAAVHGDHAADKAMKIAKHAKRLGQKYRGKSP